MKPFLINALVSIGKDSDKQLNFILENVSVKSSDNDLSRIGIDIRDFSTALAQLGWCYNSELECIYEMENPANKIDFGDVLSADYATYIFLQGTPLLYTGLNDKLGRPIFKNHRLDGATVVFCDQTGQWGLKYPKRDMPIPLFKRNKDFFIEGYDLNVNPMSHEQQNNQKAVS